MNGRLLTYVLVKTIYDTGKDYFDAFVPFAVDSVDKDSESNISDIQRKLNENYKIDVPEHVLKTILKRAKKLRYLSQPSYSTYAITEDGLQLIEHFESEKSTQRKLSYIIEDLQSHFRNCGHDIQLNEIYDILLSFIHKNMESVIEYINPITKFNDISFDYSQKYAAVVYEYVKQAETGRPDIYAILRQIYIGALISSTLYSNEPSEINDIENQKFQQCSIYLDSNFVFSLLGLRDTDICKPAKELFKILKDLKFKIYIFTCTVNEICTLLKRYSQNMQKYPSNIHINSIYSFMKQNGWTETSVIAYTTNIENELNRYGIKIADDIIDLREYQPKNIKMVELIMTYKTQDNTISRKHDIFAIEKIKEIRRNEVRKFENCKAFFLTSDKALCRFNYEEFGHKDTGTVCEIILDSMLTNLLWLKNPKSTIPLTSVMGVYTNHSFIDRRVWERFYSSLKELYASGSINDDQVSALFYHKFIENELSEISSTSGITQDYTLGLIEKAKCIFDDKVENIVLEKQTEFIELLQKKDAQHEEELLNITRSANEIVIDKDKSYDIIKSELDTIRETITKKADQIAGVISIIFSIVASLVSCVLFVLLGIVVLKNNQSYVLYYIAFISFVFGGSILFRVFSKTRSFLKHRLFCIILNRKLQNVGLKRAVIK